MKIEVTYALPERQWLESIEVPAGTTAMEAVRRSGLAGAFREFDPEAHSLGIFGRQCEPDRVLRAGDRVEVYRPLAVDPKEARRLRARATARRRKAD